MRFDASSLRRTSGSGDEFPWRERDVPFIQYCLLAAWPGQWRQDVFLIDDRVAALQGLEPPGRRSG
jgi:hypothetical protein